jgi:putative flippase GtrA
MARMSENFWGSVAKFWKFSLVGAAQLLTSFLIFAFIFNLNQSLPVGVILALSYFLSAILGYALNARFVFHQNSKLSRFVFYVLGYVPSFFLNWLLLEVLREANLVILQAALLLFLATLNFLIQKFLTFRSG